MRMIKGRKQARLGQQLAEAQRQAADYRAALQRTTTELTEYRHRATKAREEAVTVAQIELLAHLLPILDDLARALRVTPPELADSPWIKGILLVAKALSATLIRLGLERFGSVNTIFDPRYHDVVATEVRPDLVEGTITRVILPGYTFTGRLVRPAQVIVSIPG